MSVSVSVSVSLSVSACVCVLSIPVSVFVSTPVSVLVSLPVSVFVSIPVSVSVSIPVSVFVYVPVSVSVSVCVCVVSPVCLCSEPCVSTGGLAAKTMGRSHLCAPHALFLRMRALSILTGLAGYRGTLEQCHVRVSPGAQAVGSYQQSANQTDA